MPVEPLIQAIKEIITAREHEYRKGIDPDYLAAAHHCNEAINFISSAIHKTQLDTNREKLHKKCERLSKKIDQLKSSHETRERKRWEAIRNEEAKSRFYILKPYKEIYDEDWIEYEQNRVEIEENVGLKEELQNVLEVLSLPLSPRKYIGGKNKSTEPLLIYGPKNVGKRYLTHKLLPLFFPDAVFVTVKPEDLYSHGDIVLEYAFMEAAKKLPSVLVLEDMQHPVYEVKQNVNQLHHERLIRNMLNNPDVQVVGLTTAPWSMSPDLLTKFTHTQLIDFPTEEEKTEFLKNKFGKMKHNLTSASFDLLAQNMDDFLPSDVHLFVDKCERRCEELNKLAEENKVESGTEEEILAFMRQFMFTFNTAKTILNSIKENIEELPNVKPYQEFETMEKKAEQV